MNRIDDLKKKIHALTDEIESKLHANLMNEMDKLLQKRHQMLVELITLSTSLEQKKELIDFLAIINQKDQVNLHALAEKRDHVKSGVSTVNKIKEYLE